MKIGVCYICGRKGPINKHHIIPQTFGGENGPVVDLDAACHQTIHSQALNFESKNPNVLMFTEQEWIRAKPLVDYIILAIRANKQNPDYTNPANVTIKMTKFDVFLLHLMKEDSNYTNMNDYLKDLLRAFIKSKFPSA